MISPTQSTTTSSSRAASSFSTTGSGTLLTTTCPADQVPPTIAARVSGIFSRGFESLSSWLSSPANKGGMDTNNGDIDSDTKDHVAHRGVGDLHRRRLQQLGPAVGIAHLALPSTPLRDEFVRADESDDRRRPLLDENALGILLWQFFFNKEFYGEINHRLFLEWDIDFVGVGALCQKLKGYITKKLPQESLVKTTFSVVTKNHPLAKGNPRETIHQVFLTTHMAWKLATVNPRIKDFRFDLERVDRSFKDLSAKDLMKIIEEAIRTKDGDAIEILFSPEILSSISRETLQYFVIAYASAHQEITNERDRRFQDTRIQILKILMQPAVLDLMPEEVLEKIGSELVMAACYSQIEVFDILSQPDLLNRISQETLENCLNKALFLTEHSEICAALCQRPHLVQHLDSETIERSLSYAFSDKDVAIVKTLLLSPGTFNLISVSYLMDIPCFIVEAASSQDSREMFQTLFQKDMLDLILTRLQPADLMPIVRSVANSSSPKIANVFLSELETLEYALALIQREALGSRAKLDFDKVREIVAARKKLNE